MSKYSPYTMEHMPDSAPDWAVESGVDAPIYNPQIQSCFWSNGGFVVIESAAEAEAEQINNSKAAARIERDQRINAIGWRIERYRDQIEQGIATTDSTQTYAALLEYRQALRDITAQLGFPTTINWPTQP